VALATSLKYSCVISFDHVGVQQFLPAFLIPGRSKSGELFEGSCECVPVIESALERESFQVQLVYQPLLDQFFAMPDSLLVEIVVEIKPYLPVEECGQLISGDLHVIGEVPYTVTKPEKRP